MRPLAFLTLVLLALPAAASARPKSERRGAPSGVPSWITKELKPIVNKPVVTR